jgi:hypothetical protein
VISGWWFSPTTYHQSRTTDKLNGIGGDFPVAVAELSDVEKIGAGGWLSQGFAQVLYNLKGGRSGRIDL